MGIVVVVVAVVEVVAVALLVVVARTVNSRCSICSSGSG